MPQATPSASAALSSKRPVKNNRKYFTNLHEFVALPNLLQLQLNSYRWFVEEGIKETLEEITPIRDFTERDLELYLEDYYLDEPKFGEVKAREKNATYEAPLRCKAKLLNKQTGEIKEQEIFLGDLPLMTDRGTFIINGVERVVVSQLIRSPGVFFSSEIAKGRKWFGAKIIPNRGAWLELETDTKGTIFVKIDRKRKIAITALLRAFGAAITNEDIKDLFKDVNTDPSLNYIEATIKKDPSRNQEEGLKEVYKRIRPGDLATIDNAKSMIDSMFFQFDRYDFGRVGRYKINQRLGITRENTKENRVLIVEDIVEIIKEVIRLNVAQGEADDIDHLGNRRVRTVGELIQLKFRTGVVRMERMVKDRMSTTEVDQITPGQLINARPVMAAIKEFFTSSQLSQFMDQTNPLAELAHKRRLSAMGPGGLSRERAGFDVRDVHQSHYGRICPIATPEGPNIGLVGHLASYARINDYGFIETPYRKVVRQVPNKSSETVGKFSKEPVKNAKGKLIVDENQEITKAIAKKLEELDTKTVDIKAYVTDEVIYLDAFEEDKAITTPATTPIRSDGYFDNTLAEVRINGKPGITSTNKIDFMDVSPQQIISETTSLIPFLEHDDANRALMGSNMQRQAVSCIVPQAPVVGSGVEAEAAFYSGQLITAKKAGKVVELDAGHIKVLETDGNVAEYVLQTYQRSNTSTSLNQRPVVSIGDTVKKHQVLADGTAMEKGELALGQNLLVAFMSFEGGNYEDAILISEDVVADDRYSSVHIEDFSINVRDTKLGPEVVTRDIPNVGEEKLKDLDEEGIIRIGATIESGDILVGKITPKGEAELTAEEKLLRAIFGEKARDVKDTSLYMPHGGHGKVVDVKIFSRDNGDKLPAGVIKSIQVSVAQLRKVQVGDKMAGRHGNKGVISRILPRENMPFLADGTPVDIILNPLGVASRMNLGQIMETHLGWAAHKLGYNVASPALSGVSEEQIRGELKKAGLPEDGKITLYDGRTGKPFDNKIMVGILYMLKLHHLVEDKIHQRSIGPYSLVTQQPLGGKAQFGGQRFGEMEVWALSAYGAAHTLQEVLTIKSDDVMGRSKAYESIVKGEPIKKPNIPESFNVLIKELKSLCLDVEPLEAEVEASEESETASTKIAPIGKRAKSVAPAKAAEAQEAEASASEEDKPSDQE
jgi:DNA-directed RNA polymerase subunit beta